MSVTEGERKKAPHKIQKQKVKRIPATSVKRNATSWFQGKKMQLIEGTGKQV